MRSFLTRPSTWLLLAAGGALVIGTTALAALSPDVTSAEVIGLYQVEPGSRGNATTPLVFQRFSADGTTRLEFVNLHDEVTGLRAEVVIDSKQSSKAWSIQASRLCIGTEPRRACSELTRDAVTGDLVVANQRLIKLRTEGLVTE